MFGLPFSRRRFACLFYRCMLKYFLAERCRTAAFPYAIFAEYGAPLPSRLYSKNIKAFQNAVSAKEDVFMNQNSSARSRLRKFFGTWNLFEILLLSVSLIVTTTIFCLGKEKNIWSLLSSVSGIVCVIFTAKGNPVAQYLSIIFALLYSVVSYQSKYYGEMLIYLFLMIPIHIACIVSWIKNRRNPESAEVKINTLRPSEYILMGAADCLATVAFYFLLKRLGAEELIISTVSLVSSVSAAYLMLRRSEYYAVCFIVNDIILMMLWGLRVFHYGPAYLPVFVTPVVFLINDAYGFRAETAAKKSKRRINGSCSSNAFFSNRGFLQYLQRRLFYIFYKIFFFRLYKRPRL